MPRTPSSSRKAAERRRPSQTQCDPNQAPALPAHAPCRAGTACLAGPGVQHRTVRTLPKASSDIVLLTFKTAALFLPLLKNVVPPGEAKDGGCPAVSSRPSHGSSSKFRTCHLPPVTLGKQAAGAAGTREAGCPAFPHLGKSDSGKFLGALAVKQSGLFHLLLQAAV